MKSKKMNSNAFISTLFHEIHISMKFAHYGNKNHTFQHVNSKIWRQQTIANIKQYIFDFLFGIYETNSLAYYKYKCDEIVRMVRIKKIVYMHQWCFSWSFFFFFFFKLIRKNVVLFISCSLSPATSLLVHTNR